MRTLEERPFEGDVLMVPSLSDENKKIRSNSLRNVLKMCLVAGGCLAVGVVLGTSLKGPAKNERETKQDQHYIPEDEEDGSRTLSDPEGLYFESANEDMSTVIYPQEYLDLVVLQDLEAITSEPRKA
jgi:hypothetical protein